MQRKNRAKRNPIGQLLTDKPLMNEFHRIIQSPVGLALAAQFGLSIQWLLEHIVIERLERFVFTTGDPNPTYRLRFITTAQTDPTNQPDNWITLMPPVLSMAARLTDSAVELAEITAATTADVAKGVTGVFEDNTLTNYLTWALFGPVGVLLNDPGVVGRTLGGLNPTGAKSPPGQTFL